MLNIRNKPFVSELILKLVTPSSNSNHTMQSFFVKQCSKLKGRKLAMRCERYVWNSIQCLAKKKTFLLDYVRVVSVYLQIFNIQKTASDQLLMDKGRGREMKIAFNSLPLCTAYIQALTLWCSCKDKLFYAKAKDMTTLVTVPPKETNVSLRHQRDAQD